MDHSLRVYSKITSAMKPFLTTLMKMQPTFTSHILTPSLFYFSSLYLVSANMLYIFICSLFVSPLTDTPKIHIIAIIYFHLFYSHTTKSTDPPEGAP